MYMAIVYTGYEFYESFGKEIGACEAKTIGQIKRMASKLCNKYHNTADAFTVMVDGNIVPFYRFNAMYPDGSIVRGEWH